MIDHDEAIQALMTKLEQMTYDEREQYLKKMGFSFEGDKEGNESNESTKDTLTVIINGIPHQIPFDKNAHSLEVKSALERIDYRKRKPVVLITDDKGRIVRSMIGYNKLAKRRLAFMSRFLSRKKKMKEKEAN